MTCFREIHILRQFCSRQNHVIKSFGVDKSISPKMEVEVLTHCYIPFVRETGIQFYTIKLHAHLACIHMVWNSIYGKVLVCFRIRPELQFYHGIFLGGIVIRYACQELPIVGNIVYIQILCRHLINSSVERSEIVSVIVLHITVHHNIRVCLFIVYPCPFTILSKILNGKIVSKRFTDASTEVLLWVALVGEYFYILSFFCIFLGGTHHKLHTLVIVCRKVYFPYMIGNKMAVNVFRNSTF